LTDLARVYCLGIETGPGTQDMSYRSSFAYRSGRQPADECPCHRRQKAHLLIGDRNACLEAARLAVQQALQNLGKARPLLALVLVDLAWHYLFEAQQAQLTAEIQTALGKIPLVGAYTLGQVYRPQPEATLRLENQWLQVVILGEAEG